MTPVSASPAPASAASSASAAAPGKHGSRSTGATSAGDAFAALLQSLAGAADAAPAVPGAVDADPAAAAESGDAKPSEAAGVAPAVAMPPPLVLPFVPVTPALQHAVARSATPLAADEPSAPVGSAGSTTRAKDPSATLAAMPAAVEGAPPPPAHAATPDLPAGPALKAVAGEGDSHTSARPAEIALPQGLHALGAQAPAAQAPDAPATVPVHQAALPSHPLDKAFAGDVAAEVKLMADNGLQRAELHLNPADLGPVRIELSVSAQTADLHFSAAHATTREGIAQALPALRELLAGQGLQLGQAGVGSGGTGQQAFAWQAAREQGDRQPGSRGGDGSGVRGLGAAPVTVTVRRNQGMLDLYA